MQSVLDGTETSDGRVEIVAEFGQIGSQGSSIWSAFLGMPASQDSLQIAVDPSDVRFGKHSVRTKPHQNVAEVNLSQNAPDWPDLIRRSDRHAAGREPCHLELSPIDSLAQMSEARSTGSLQTTPITLNLGPHTLIFAPLIALPGTPFIIIVN